MPSKLVTNYDSMFSDLPNYPRQHEVRWEVTGNRNFGEVDFFAATGSDVGGRDRSKFFKRPILPNATPIPFIRYAKEMRFVIFSLTLKYFKNIKINIRCFTSCKLHFKKERVRKNGNI